MAKERKEKHFIQKPLYEGGNKALKQFIVKNLQYPKTALEQKIEGTVSIRYTIDNKGKVIKVKIISGIGYGCDEEATRLVKALVFSASRNRGRRMLFHKTIQIHFRLPKKQAVKKVEGPTEPIIETPPPVTEIQYTYSTTSSTKKDKPVVPKPKPSGGYSITINYS